MFLERLFEHLNEKGVRYLIAGGVAGVLHGNPRFTKDLDLFTDFEENNLKELVKVFESLGFVPRVPIKPEEFVSAENRARWKSEKGMLAFTFINPKNPFENVDILLDIPISFDEAYRRRKIFKAGEVVVPTVSVGDLILMKEKAGRPQDLQDIKILKAVHKIE